MTTPAGLGGLQGAAEGEGVAHGVQQVDAVVVAEGLGAVETVDGRPDGVAPVPMTRAS